MGLGQTSLETMLMYFPAHQIKTMHRESLKTKMLEIIKNDEERPTIIDDCPKDGGEEFFTEMHCIL